MAAISWVMRRQRNLTGGPSGTAASVSIGSGRSNRRIGRHGTSSGTLPWAAWAAAGREVAGRATTANSGMWVPWSLDAQHTAQPDAGAEPVGKVGEIGGYCLRVDPELVLDLVQGLGLEHAEADEIEPIAGIQSILAEALDPFAQQPQDGISVAGGPAGADRDPLHGPIDPEQDGSRSGGRRRGCAPAGRRRCRASGSKAASTSSWRAMPLAKRRSAR